VVDPKLPSTLYAATTNGFYKSTNSGATWTVKRATRCWDISVHSNGGAVELLAAFQDGLFVTRFAGSARDVRRGPPGDQTSGMPTVLEAAWTNYRLMLLGSFIVLVLVSAVIVRQRRGVP